MIAEVEATGGDIVIAHDKAPAAKLVPIASAVKRRRFGSMRGIVELDDGFFDPLPDDDLAAWNGERHD